MTSISKIASVRKAFIAEEADVSAMSVLEIGAFDNPIFRRELGDDVRYIDWFSREELTRMHATNPNRRPELIVDVDYVVKHPKISRATSDRFDLVCASHVIEHIPDPISWFAEIGRLLKPDGSIFLAIPDRRFTFDYYRNNTSATEIVRAFSEELTKPSVWHLLDHFYYHQKVDLAALLRGETPAPFKSRFTLAKAIEMARAQAGDYTDAHCWVFAADTFPALIAELVESDLFGFRLDRLKVAPGTNEFFVMLSRIPVAKEEGSERTDVP